MTFDWTLLGAIAARTVRSRISLRRLILLLLLTPVYCLLQLCNCVGFILDDLFFRDWRRQPVHRPVFITGVPRSGTTRMHRLLAQDDTRFSCMAAWEILCAPSVTQKKLFAGLGRLDHWCGGHGKRLIITIEQHCFGEFSRKHPSSLFAPEEDDLALLHMFATPYLVFMFPYPDLFQPFWRFDEQMPAHRRRRIMGWYRHSIQRHLYAFGPDKQFLSKNPGFCPRLRSLRAAFPNACFIHLVRQPEQTIPSLLSLFKSLFASFYITDAHCPLQTELLELADYWYRYPLTQLAQLPPRAYHLVDYAHLTKAPDRIVRQCYRTFGFFMPAAYRRRLHHAARQAHTYRSSHRYRPEDFGLTHSAIADRFRDPRPELHTPRALRPNGTTGLLY